MKDTSAPLAPLLGDEPLRGPLSRRRVLISAGAGLVTAGFAGLTPAPARAYALPAWIYWTGEVVLAACISWAVEEMLDYAWESTASATVYEEEDYALPASYYQPYTYSTSYDAGLEIDNQVNLYHGQERISGGERSVSLSELKRIRYEHGRRRGTLYRPAGPKQSFAAADVSSFQRACEGARDRNGAEVKPGKYGNVKLVHKRRFKDRHGEEYTGYTLVKTGPDRQPAGSHPRRDVIIVPRERAPEQQQLLIDLSA